MDKSDYIFTSERLGFRTWTDQDKAPFYTMNSDPEVMKHFPSLLSREESDEYVNGYGRHFNQYGFCFYAVDLLEEDQFVGFIGCKHVRFEAPFTPAVEIGWRIAKKYWNRGLASEGAKRCLDFMQNNLKQEKIHAYAACQNLASLRVMEKIGMHRSGEFIHPELDEKSPLQPMIYYTTQNS